MKTRCRDPRSPLILWLAALFLASTATPALAQELEPGDLLVVLQSPGRILRVDRLTGVQTELASGGLLLQPTSLTLLSAGIAVTDSGDLTTPPAVIQVALPGGAQSTLTSGQELIAPVGLAFESGGSLLIANVIDPLTSGSSLVRAVLPGGAQSVLSPIPVPSRLGGIVVSGADIFVSDEGTDVISSVDPGTGALTPVSSGGQLLGPLGIAIESAGAGGSLVVAQGSGSVLRVDRGTGAQTGLAAGGHLVQPFGIVVEADGRLVVSDKSAKALIRIDPASGTQTVVTTFATEPRGIAVVPGDPPEPVPALPGPAAAAAILALLGALAYGLISRKS